MKVAFFTLSALLVLSFPALAQQDVKVTVTGNKVQVQLPGNIPGLSSAQGALQQQGTGVTVDSQGVTSQAVGQGNSASVVTGIGSGADIQGVTVINGEVWIDGEKVPGDARKFTGRSGKTYIIDRSQGGVRVHTE